MILVWKESSLSCDIPLSVDGPYEVPSSAQILPSSLAEWTVYSVCTRNFRNRYGSEILLPSLSVIRKGYDAMVLLCCNGTRKGNSIA